MDALQLMIYMYIRYINNVLCYILSFSILYTCILLLQTLFDLLLRGLLRGPLAPDSLRKGVVFLILRRTLDLMN